MPRVPPNRFGTGCFLRSRHATFPPKQIWKKKSLFLDSQFNFLESGLTPCPTNLIRKFTCSETRTWPISTPTVGSPIQCFWNPDLPHFHPNRFGDSLFAESRHAPLPSKHTCQWQFTLFWNPVCLISPPAVLEIHFLWNRDMFNFPPNTSVNSLFVESGHVPFPPQQMWTFTV